MVRPFGVDKLGRVGGFTVPVHFTGKGVGQLGYDGLFLYLDPYNGNQVNFFPAG